MVMVLRDLAPTGLGRFVERALAIRYLASAVVFVTLTVIGTLAGVALYRGVTAQEHQLLVERSNEFDAYLQASGAQTSATLTAVGDVVARLPRDRSAFLSLAKPLTATGSVVSVIVMRDGQPVVAATTENQALVGRPAAARLRPIVAQSLATPGLVYQLTIDSTSRRVVDALRTTTSATTLIDTPLTAKPQPAPVAATSPYRDLNLAIYIGTSATARELLFVSGAVPGSSDATVSRVSTVGGARLFVVISARAPLTGSFAHVVPWLVVGGGVLLALVLALLVQLLIRRRAYALRLVEERTRELQRAQHVAEAANRSKSEFLSRMSHELRTPLNAVLGYGQLLELDHLTAEQEQAVRQITRGGRHLLELINEILDISRIETGSLTMSPEPVHVDDVLAEVLELVRPLAAERDIRLIGVDVDDSGRGLHVLADRRRLEQILLNLLSNAIKYNREGGTVSIDRAAVAGGRVQIRVTDTGQGIRSEQFDLLFAPFERLGAERTTIEGTGIGLTLSHHLAKAMAGTLGVASVVGRGSTFWIDLAQVEGPVERVERLGQIEKIDAEAPVSIDAGPAILHIEDNPANLELIERVLAQRPWVRVLRAAQGRLGLDLARQHVPALVLLDLDLADVAGEEIFAALRRDPATSAIPVVIISADAMPRRAARLLDAGAAAYLTKPVDVPELLTLVDLALSAEPLSAGPLSAETLSAETLSAAITLDQDGARQP